MGSTKHTARMIGLLLVAVFGLLYFTVDVWQGEEEQQAAVLRAYAR